MVRPGFGLKDAPRLWNMRLLHVMKKLGFHSLIGGPQVLKTRRQAGNKQAGKKQKEKSKCKDIFR
eukprot:10212048-Prorocentrum_lima.AAC.1